MKVRFTPQESPLPGVSCAPSKHFNSDRLQGVGVFKASAVRLVLDEGKTVGAAARDLDLTETALREWVKRADRTHGRTGLTTAERTPRTARDAHQRTSRRTASNEARNRVRTV